jgi:hypothetical protein
MSSANSMPGIRSRIWPSTKSIRCHEGAVEADSQLGSMRKMPLPGVSTHNVLAKPEESGLTESQFVHELQHVADTHQGNDAVCGLSASITATNKRHYQ